MFGNYASFNEYSTHEKDMGYPGEKYATYNNMSYTPITNNRFNNMANRDLSAYNNEPYYVSGIPIGNSDKTSKINMDDSIPYNGSNDNHYTYDQNRWNQQNQHCNPRKTSTFMPSTNCPGASIQSIRVPNTSLCQKICINDDDCKMWSFNNSTQQCFIKDKVRPCRTNNNFTSGRIIENKPQPVPYQTRQSSTLDGIKFLGESSGTFDTPNSNTCKYFCVWNPKCNKWTYIEGTNNEPNKCTLQYGKAYTIARNPDAVSGEIYVEKISPEPTPLCPPVHPSPVHPTPIHPSPVHPTPIHPSPIQPSPVHPSPVHPSPVHPSPTPFIPIPEPIPYYPCFSVI